MNKEHFDYVFDTVFPDAVRQSFMSIKPPSAEEIRTSWLQLYRKRRGLEHQRTDALVGKENK